MNDDIQLFVRAAVMFDFLAFPKFPHKYNTAGAVDYVFAPAMFLFIRRFGFAGFEYRTKCVFSFVCRSGMTYTKRIPGQAVCAGLH